MVNLEKAEVVIAMVNPIPIEKFEEALGQQGGTHSISMPRDWEYVAVKGWYD